MVKLEEIIEAHAAMVRRIATVYERHPDRVDIDLHERYVLGTSSAFNFSQALVASSLVAPFSAAMKSLTKLMNLA